MTVTVKGADGVAVVVWQENQSRISDTAELAKLIEKIELTRDGRSACIELPKTPNDEANVLAGSCAW